jgi:hypothetical protein
MPYHLFERTWFRSNHWGLMVLEPNQMPVLAAENNYLAAVLGLEKSRQFQGDLEGAETAFRAATELHPQSAPAFNNLSQVLFEQRTQAGSPGSRGKGCCSGRAAKIRGRENTAGERRA